MFRTLRPAALAASLLVIAGTAVACSPSASPSSSTSPSDSTEISGEITFSTWWAYADQDLIAKFTEKYPDVKVNLDFSAIDAYPTKIQALASSNDLPDVFAAQGATLTGTAEAGKLLDLTDALKSPAYDGSFASLGESFVPELLKGANAGLQDNETATWGVPFNAISVASIYNEDAFAKAGVTAPKTFDELLSNCTKLADAGYIPMSLTGKAWISWWARLGWDQTMRDDDVADFSVDSPGFVKGYEIVKKMADAKCWSDTQITTDIAGETSLFLQGKTAQFVSVPENFLQAVVDGADFPLATYVLPPLDGVEPNRILGGGNANVIVVSKDSKNIAAATAFAKFLTSEATESELAKTQYTIPSIQIDVSASSPLMAAYLDAASQGFVDSSTYMPAFSTAGTTKLDQEILPSLILGKITPEEAAKQSADIFDK